MPEFVCIPEIKTRSDLLAAIRLSIAAELEAVNLYRGIADRCKDVQTQKLMLEIADDELRHLGSFQDLLDRFSPGDVERRAEGKSEADEVIGK